MNGVDQQAEMLSAQKIPTLRQMSDQFMQTDAVRQALTLKSLGLTVTLLSIRLLRALRCHHD